MKIKTKTTCTKIFTQSLQFPRFKISTFRIGRSVMERLLDASTCWHGRTQRAAGNTIPEDRERLVTNTFIIKHRNRTFNTTHEAQCSEARYDRAVSGSLKCSNQPSSCVKCVYNLIHKPTSIKPQNPDSTYQCVRLNASITGYEPRKQFAIGLTVEQISQVYRKAASANQEAESTIIQPKIIHIYGKAGAK